MDCLKMVRNTLNDFSRPRVKFLSEHAVVKVVDGTRKMRHLFLFDNSLVCTKPGDRLDFIIKWVLRLSQVWSISSGITPEGGDQVASGALSTDWH